MNLCYRMSRFLRFRTFVSLLRRLIIILVIMRICFLCSIHSWSSLIIHWTLHDRMHTELSCFIKTSRKWKFEFILLRNAIFRDVSQFVILRFLNSLLGATHLLYFLLELFFWATWGEHYELDEFWWVQILKHCWK